MATNATIEAPRIYPTFRYRDAPKMIDFLCEAFGFAVHAKYMDGAFVSHAQLAFGSSMIMLGTVRDDDYGRMVGGPADGGKSIYVVCDDIDALFARAKDSRRGRRGRTDEPRLWKPRIHLPRPGRQCLVVRHLLAEGP